MYMHVAVLLHVCDCACKHIYSYSTIYAAVFLVDTVYVIIIISFMIMIASFHHLSCIQSLQYEWVVM